MNAAISDETLRLNPNCCYKACPGCKSVARLVEFQSRHPTDWPTRLRGSPRLLAAATGRSSVPLVERVAPPRCDECGSFDAVNFGGTWICPACCATRGACCAEREL